MSEANMAERERGILQVHVGDDFDGPAAQRLARTLREADARLDTRVDFSAARSIDARALYVLACALSELRRRVQLVGLSDRNSRLLQYLGIPVPAVAGVGEDRA